MVSGSQDQTFVHCQGLRRTHSRNLFLYLGRCSSERSGTHCASRKYISWLYVSLGNRVWYHVSVSSSFPKYFYPILSSSGSSMSHESRDINEGSPPFRTNFFLYHLLLRMVTLILTDIKNFQFCNTHSKRSRFRSFCSEA